MTQHVPGIGEVRRDTEWGIGPDGAPMRLYTARIDGERVRLPSVTSVLKYADTDTSGLESWKQQKDGEGNSPHHEHLFWYKRHRGTLCHYAALAPFQDGNVWSDDELESAQELITLSDREVSGENPGLVLYSLWKDWGFVDTKVEFFNHVHTRMLSLERDQQYCLARQCRYDMRQFLPKWQEATDALGISQESIIDAERFLFDPEMGVAGQCDLIYDAPDGARVLADLKTSAGLYEKHTLQSALYAAMVPYDIDRLEVLRVHPRRGWEVYTPPETEAMRGVLTAGSGYSKWEGSRSELTGRCARAVDAATEHLTATVTG